MDSVRKGRGRNDKLFSPARKPMTAASRLYRAVMHCLYRCVHESVRTVRVEVGDEDVDILDKCVQAVQWHLLHTVSSLECVPINVGKLPVPKFPHSRVDTLLHDVAGCFVKMLQWQAVFTMQHIESEMVQCTTPAQGLGLFRRYVLTVMNTYGDHQDVLKECETPLSVFFNASKE